MGRFADVANAQVLTKLPWYKPGSYIVRVLNCKNIVSQDKNTEYYIVETEVLASTNPEINVGGKYSWTQDRKKKYVGAAAVRAFIAACLGIDANDPNINEDVIEASVGGEDGEGPQPLAGKILALSCDDILTKAKTHFTRHTWQHYVPPQEGGA